MPVSPDCVLAGRWRLTGEQQPGSAPKTLQPGKCSEAQGARSPEQASSIPGQAAGEASLGAIGENVGGWDEREPCETTCERNGDREVGHSPGALGSHGRFEVQNDCSGVGLGKITLAAVRKRLEGLAQGRQGAQAGAKSVFRRNISSCWD